MNRMLLTVFLGVFSTLLLGQNPVPQTVTLDFGVVLDTSPKTLALVLSNPSSGPTTIYAVLPESNGFAVSPDSMVLAAGNMDTFFVTFSPRHNVYHNQELLLLPDRHRGALTIDLLAQGRYSNSYYQTTENLAGEALKTALRNRLAQGYTQLSYNQARDQMYMSLDNQRFNGQGATVNTLECVYTGTVITGFSDRTTAQFMGFNTEHTFPQGFFGQNLPMRSDIHHLFPTTESSNSERANLPFGVVPNPTWQVGGSRSNGTRFEPRDAHKGPVARSMSYFVLRYQNYQGFYAPQEAILRQWHEQYPPTSVEIARNEGIFSTQKNRNPFVDYPQFIERISSLSGTAVLPVVEEYFPPESVIDFDTLTGPAIYAFPLVNTGTEILQVEAPLFDDPRLSESSNLSYPYSLAPGESLPLDIALQTTGTPGLNGQLLLPIRGLDTLVVPVRAVWTLAADLHASWPDAWRVLPTQEGYRITWPPDAPRKWRLTNPLGQTLLQGESHTDHVDIRLTQIPSGTYVLVVEDQTRRSVRRVIWQN